MHHNIAEFKNFVVSSSTLKNTEGSYSLFSKQKTTDKVNTQKLTNTIDLKLPVL